MRIPRPPIVLFTCIVMLFSCEKTHDELIIGKWLFETVHWAEFRNGTLTRENETGDYPVESMEFLMDGTLNYCYEDMECIAGQWNTHGDSLMLKYENYENYESVYIRALDEQQLKLLYSQEYDYDTLFLLLEATLTFNKQ